MGSPHGVGGPQGRGVARGAGTPQQHAGGWPHAAPALPVRCCEVGGGGSASTSCGAAATTLPLPLPTLFPPVPPLQYFDVLRDIGMTGKSNTVFLDHTPAGVANVSGQIRAGFMQASAGGAGGQGEGLGALAAAACGACAGLLPTRRHAALGGLCMPGAAARVPQTEVPLRAVLCCLGRVQANAADTQTMRR